MKSIAIAVIMVLTLIICTQTSYAEQKAATKNHTGIYLGTQDYQDSFSISLPNYQVSQDQLGVVQYARADIGGNVGDAFTMIKTPNQVKRSRALANCVHYAHILTHDVKIGKLTVNSCKELVVSSQAICDELDSLVEWCCSGWSPALACSSLAVAVASM